MRNKRGRSYEKRVVDIQAIYAHYSKIGVSNRDIWRRYVYPRFYICERTFNNIIARQVEETEIVPSALLHPEEGLPLWQQSKRS